MSSRITFVSENTQNTSEEIIFDGRRTIYELMRNLKDFKFDFPCGGKKTCRKCKIKIKDGFEFISEPDSTEKKFITEEEIKESIRYACMCEVFGDVTVELINNKSSDKIEIQTKGLNSKNITPNKFKKIALTLSESTLENPLSDEKNLIFELNKTFKDFKSEKLPYHLIKKLTELDTQKIDVVLSGTNIIDVRKSNEFVDTIDIGYIGDIYGAAVDIGTTTAAVYLYSLTTGNCLAVAAEENPQRAYGADVITRINYTIENKDGLNNLKQLILSLISKLIKDLCEENNIDSNDVYSVVLTGNTVMQHIAAGFSPKNIAFTPFTAVSLFGFDVTTDEIDISGINKNAVIYFPPAFASYVGGDISTGIIASDTDLCDNLRVFLDVGTNGEIGFGDKNSLIFCATAAGPAFEGAHIKLGMAGIKGAINKIYLDDSSQIVCETIGNIAPKGICGSGIIDAVALMLELGVLDETGRILDDSDEEEIPVKYQSFTENLREIDGENAFILDLNRNIYITQKDIREIQLAKAAVSAGIMTLLDRAGKSLSDISELVLAGGFGAHINKKSACRIGLIPNELEEKITIAGNTAGMGAAAILLDCSAVERAKKIIGISKYIELSGDAFFMDEYVERMMF